MTTLVSRALRVLPGPRSTPFTFWYLVLLGLTTLLLRFATPRAAHRLIAMSSTDAVNLQRHPTQAIFLSALWLAGAHWPIYAVIFTVVIAPMERRIGSLWTISMFASGHILATLATELPVLAAIREHLLPHDDAHLVDVGVSYGLFTIAGALVLMLPTPTRWWALAVVNAAFLGIYLESGPAGLDSAVTAIGHMLSTYIGVFGWLPWLRRRGLVGSLRLSSWSRRRTTPALANPT